MAEPADERLHEWRKRVKYHWYHVRLLRSLARGKMDKRRKRLKRLSDTLGDDHDLVVLAQIVASEPAFARKQGSTCRPT